jgi:archaellum component FlaC
MEDAWQVVERPFTSDVPIIGPLIVFVRERWNRFAAKWYVLKVQEQQNRFNWLILELAHQVADIRAGMEDRDRRVQAGMEDRDRRIQARFEMLDQLIEQQADLIADRGLSISGLAEAVSRLSMRVEELEERIEESAQNDPT